MSGSPSQVEYENKFKTVTLEFFGFIKEVIEGLNNEGVSGCDPEEMDTPVNLVKLYNTRELILSFIDSEHDWENIKGRVLSFILETIPQTYKKIPFDVDVLTIPLRWYNNKIKQYPGKTSEDLEVISEEEQWPVMTAEVNTMWEYFEAMVSLSCKYILEVRKQDPEFYSDIDVTKYLS